MPKSTIALPENGLKKPRKPGRINWLAQSILTRQLHQLAFGEIVLADGSEQSYGQKTERFPHKVRIDVQGPDFYGDVVFGGTVGAAESYVAGDWECDDLPTLIRILLRNRQVLEGLDGGLSSLATPMRRWLHWANRNSLSGSRRNIEAHYDLGNDFFKLFLDERMMYSCALFEPPDLSLEEASYKKLETICGLLDLRSTDKVIEIGTGWGGFAIHAAKTYGCHVTTTTISEHQYDLAAARIAAEGLGDRITLLKEDYRNLEGSYDKLVSIEMIEAVGHHYFDVFFQKCSQLLTDEGLMLLQAITINDRVYRRARDEVDFIKRYIFPGSCIPAILPLTEAATRSTDLQLVYLRDIGRHYATTLRLWRERFLEHREAILELGYSIPFIRLWAFYLAYCEGGYAEGALGDLHLLYRKPYYAGRLP